MKIKLEDVLEAIESASDEFEYYCNTESGEIIMYGDSMLTGIDQSDFLEELEADDDNKYIELPSKFEINDYHIMETFIWSLPEGEVRDELEDAIRGRGAFRRFKDKIYYFALEEQWFSYRDSEYKRMAVRWCEDHNIEYI
ncbi:hypothetical protein J14TS2_49950 [Bacillus sp. J14TS2]|uniref:UPF0158 family protein n=1 Tax=Bacillus sp. J14TS2 TaxID=2807188 RepID=UPI001B26BBAB|nr:UPF0158 family protein [Bacillus sp. J14TS2]GIN74520.1 hypothetical protein J14TS2_49950 [Bacillus sp. J14TS2]